MVVLPCARLVGTLLVIINVAAGILLRDDMGNMSMAISTTVPDAQRYGTRRRVRMFRARLGRRLCVCCLLRENFVFVFTGFHPLADGRFQYTTLYENIKNVLSFYLFQNDPYISVNIVSCKYVSYVRCRSPLCLLLSSHHSKKMLRLHLLLLPAPSSRGQPMLCLQRFTFA